MPTKHEIFKYNIFRMRFRSERPLTNKHPYPLLRDIF